MKTWKIAAIASMALITVTVATASAFAYLGGRNNYTPYGTNIGTSNIFGSFFGGMMGGGRMGGMMGGSYPYGYGTPASPTYPGQYGGRGCHGWNNYLSPTVPAQGTPITLDQAVGIAQSYLTSLNNNDLAIDEVEEYSQNFYALFYERNTGLGAFEMLIDKYTGNIYPEMGPNRMWNTKYGMMNAGWQTGTMTVTLEQAKTAAQQWLSANIPGTTIGDVITFYGYYHMDVLSSGTTFGMLSVNGYTAQVWYHSWHGTFMQEAEL